MTNPIIDENGNADFEVAQKVFNEEVSDRSSEVDEASKLDWFSLTVGWAIAKEMDPDDASSFASHIRYDTDLG